MILHLDPARVPGLTPEEQLDLAELIRKYEYHLDKNRLKERYYEGRVRLGEVNLGIALPKGLHGFEIGCSWGAKTVDVLAARSMFDGFVGTNGENLDELDKLVRGNNLIAEYAKAARDELKYGCTFAVLAKDPSTGCKIRFHSPATAAALWDGDKGRIRCGFAVIETEPDSESSSNWHPSLIYYYTERDLIALQLNGRVWNVTRFSHRMGRPLMEPLIWNATSGKPFGRSRLKWPVRKLIQGYVRTVANATIGLEFSTAPQKYLLGVTEDQYETVVSDKFKQYVGSIITSTTNPETGEKPTFGQLSQGNIAPHVEMLRILATQFSAATGLTVSDTGVVNDANPSSAEAITAQTQTLVTMAQQLNNGNGNALRTIAILALAIARNTTPEQLPPEDLEIMAHFKNPSMPSVSMTADAAMKIASSRPEFASTDTFLEMVGFDPAEIRRIKAQEARARGLQLLTEEPDDADLEE